MRIAWWCLVAAALGCSGHWLCGCAQPARSSHELTGVALSEDLAPAVRAARAALPTPQPETRARQDVLRYHDLVLRIQRPDSRAQAGRELYDSWRAEPENLLWFDLAVQYETLLRRGSGYDSLLVHPAYSDTASALGAFAAARPRYSRGSRGGGLLRAWQRAAELDTLQRTMVALRTATVLSDQGDPLEAVRLLLEQTEPARTLAGAALEILLWHEIARHLARAEHLDDALHAAVLAMDLAAAMGDDRWAVQTRERLGALLHARREITAAAEIYRECISASETHDYPWLHADCLDHYAMILSELGEIHQAIEVDQRSLARTIAGRDSLNVPRNLMNLADDHRRLGQIDSSLVYLEEARRWVEAFGHPRNLANFPIYEMEFHAQIGDYAKAESLLALALDRAHQGTTAAEEARLMLRFVQHGLETGQPQLAYRAIARLEQLRGSLHAWRPDENLRGEFHLAMADFLAAHGEFRRADESLAQALAAIDLGVPSARAWAFHRSAGELALMREDFREAEAAFRRCLTIAAASGEPDQVATSRFRLGHILLALGRCSEARDLLSTAQDDAAFGGRYRTKLSTQVFLGLTYACEGDHAQALACYDRLAVAGPRCPPVDLALRVQIERGRSLAALGRPREAQAALAQAHALLRAAHDRSATAELHAFTENVHRDLTEAMVGLYADHPDLLADESAVLHTLWLAEENRWGASDRRPVELERAHGPGVLAAYFVGRERSFVWVADSAGVSLHTLPGQRRLAELVWPVVADLSTPGRVPDDAALAALGRTLLEPLNRRWRRGAPLSIVPDGLLFSVPWCALPLPEDAGALVLDHGPVREAPTLADLVGAADAEGPIDRRALILGVDGEADGGLHALRHAEAEAREVAALWPAGRADLRVGAQADWDALRPQDLRDCGVLHIASHAVVHQGLPARAALRLAGPPGSPPLTLPAVSGLPLRAELVFLACCEGAARHTAGPALADFARAFLQAGAHSVVAATIRVDDEASRSLAVRFYTHWLAGEPRATALRAAQQEVRAARAEWAHPYYWAFYRLIGQDELLTTGPPGRELP